MKSLDFLCPVFREEQGIEGFHQRLKKAINPLSDRYEVRFIYVMDPSPDRTEAVLVGMAKNDPDISVIVMSRRFGHQAALLAGIDASKADALVMLDSDGQHPPELIPQLIAAWEKGAEVVQMLRQDGMETGFLKRKTSSLFYRLLSRIGSIQIERGAADYRLLDKSVVRVLRDEFHERNAFLRGLITWLGYSTEFIAFKPEAREHGASNYRPSVLLNFAIHGISSFSKFPLRLAAITGIVVSMLSMICALIMIFSYMAGAARIPGWATLVAFVSFLGGLQLFFTGILGEYIGQIFDEVKARPRYLVSRRYGRDASVPLVSSNIE